ncbi:MAG: class I SAM-dependent methyltransferase [Anaerolineae bacterium]|nr:class I SAM-dependent methyltransferase [Anaerolineae bacterium]
MTHEQYPPVCDYEGSGYQQDFWENQGRDYEDQVERLALRKLLPRSGRRALEIGAGFGRLTDELAGYEQVVLLDYSRTLLRDARARLGDERYTYVAADVYRLPFQPGLFDGATMIRVIHHMADVSLALSSIRAVLAPDAAFVLEYANKRNVKALLRYALRRQEWNPNGLEPTEFVPLNFDFHPLYMAMAVQDAGFRVEQRLPVSYFRLGALKRVVPAGALVALDNLMQSWAPLYSPSVFTLNRAAGGGPDRVAAPLAFRCPTCGGDLLPEGEDGLACAADGCGLRWVRRDGIYDFKEPERQK